MIEIERVSWLKPRSVVRDDLGHSGTWARRRFRGDRGQGRLRAAAGVVTRSRDGHRASGSAALEPCRRQPGRRRRRRRNRLLMS